MRYETIGDYFDKNDKTFIEVYNLNNEDMNFCVAIHELIEQYLCKKKGIKERDIMKFDLNFEKNRKEGDFSEPGDADSCIYGRQHRFAENIERQLAYELGLNWKKYDDKVTHTNIKVRGKKKNK